MESTPNSSRLHIAIYGMRNSGKSSLLNSITREPTSIVSDVAGTTTDSVAKAIELHGVGATLFLDTPGFDDVGEVGELRVERARQTIDRTDIALFLFQCMDEDYEREWYEKLRARQIPIIPIINKIDLRSEGELSQLESYIREMCGESPLLLSSKLGVDLEVVREAILRKINPDMTQRTITNGLVKRGDKVVLVMPQDQQAPKGRLILPQVQTLRELLDIGAIAISCSTEELSATLESLKTPPKLIITDSQIFKQVYSQKPEQTLLTSFSILMAGYKGDIDSFVEGAKAIGSLNSSSRVLIAEACTHAPISEDIGREKLPRLLRQRVGEDLMIDIVSGRDFPSDLSPYSLIIHCGGCMFNRKYMMSRVERANSQSTPITNYGVAIAYLSGILEYIKI